MNRRKFVKAVPSLAVIAGSASAFSMNTPGPQEMQPIVLPQPEKAQGPKGLERSLQVSSRLRRPGPGRPP